MILTPAKSQDSSKYLYPTSLPKILPSITAVRNIPHLKVGEIEVPYDEFQSYLKDCYEHPDTISLRILSPSDTYHVGYGYDTQSHKFVFPLENLEYNDSIRRISIRQYNPHQYASVDEMIHTFHMIYYLVPRTPMASDYLKWKFKND